MMERTIDRETHGLSSASSRSAWRGFSFRVRGEGATPSACAFWKRALDLGCIALTAPLWLGLMFCAAAWIKIASPGPVFFRQKRIGWRGQPIMLFKFRSMKPEIETDRHEQHMRELIEKNCPMTKLDVAGDPRLIPGGRLLRATALDELPQIFNVLAGEMSLVGPRPATPYELERYEPWHRERFGALPGLTGLWQVNGKNNTTFKEMIQMDIFYARNQSLRLDLAIMLQTIPTIAGQVIESQQARARRRMAKRLPDETED